MEMFSHTKMFLKGVNKGVHLAFHGYYWEITKRSHYGPPVRRIQSLDAQMVSNI